MKKLTARIVMVAAILLAAASLPHRAVLAQASAIAPMHFHHVHLNSIDPKAAADYYLKPFPATATRTTFNGYEAVKTGNVYLLFTKVSTPPKTELNSMQDSIWHFG